MEACWCHSLAAGHSPSAATLPSASPCGDLRVPAIEAALRLGGADLSTSQGTRLKDFLKTESRFLIGTLGRSEEHTSELQSRVDLVCRLLLEKKKKKEHSS